MPKHDFFSPKAIGNRQKARGLQRLKWYCQMCQKQCRDENGYRSHINSEPHQRQLLLFAGNSGRYLNTFSTQFMHQFVSLLSRRYGTKKVWANQVYQEYISAKDHVHMNSTCWSTLAGFVRYLGRKGVCVVEEEERGWNIQWIDKSPKTLAQREATLKAERMRKSQEEIDRQIIDEQIQHGKQRSFKEEGANNQEFHRKEKIAISFKPAVASSSKKPPKKVLAEFDDQDDDETEQVSEDAEINDMPWICKGLSVRILNDKLEGGKYYGQVGVVRSIIDDYIADIEVDGKLVRLDQAHLETVLPEPNGPVMIVKGMFCGQRGTLLNIDREQECAMIKLEDDDILSAIDFDTFSQFI
jgi:DNA/RNA-binding protein KIN17